MLLTVNVEIKQSEISQKHIFPFDCNPYIKGREPKRLSVIPAEEREADSVESNSACFLKTYYLILHTRTHKYFLKIIKITLNRLVKWRIRLSRQG